MADTPPHEDRARAEGFGAVAEAYDRARPSYPPAMVADLLADGPAAIIDVGCGTGKAGRLFLGAGRTVLGVEPDPRMAAVARTHGLDVEIGTFETWDAAGRRFDLLVSGTAWHWVDPVRGAAKAAEVVRPGGRFAAFWSDLRHTAEVRSVFERVYGRHAPGLLASSWILTDVDVLDLSDDPADLALAAGPWTGVVPGARTWYPWTETYSPEAWVELASTQSDHRLLGADLLSELGRELRDALEALGHPIEVEYRTGLLTARRL